MMAVRKPHFLLFCNAKVSPSNADGSPGEPRLQCRWHVVLDNLASADRLELSDRENVSSAERAELIGVIRGLESLPQPSEVTLITASPYVNKGLRYGLAAWRENDYRWEHFGSEQPIRNADLWRRIDRALQFHRVECRLIAAAADGEAVLPTAERSDGSWEPTSKLAAANEQSVAFARKPTFAHKTHAAAATRARAVTGGLNQIVRAVGALFKAAAAAAAELARFPERTVFAVEAAFDAAWLTFRSRGVA